MGEDADRERQIRKVPRQGHVRDHTQAKRTRTGPLWAKGTTRGHHGPAAVKKLSKDVPEAPPLLSEYLPGNQGAHGKDHNHGTA